MMRSSPLFSADDHHLVPGREVHSAAAAPSFCTASTLQLKKEKNDITILRILLSALLWYLHKGAGSPRKPAATVEPKSRVLREVGVWQMHPGMHFERGDCWLLFML